MDGSEPGEVVAAAVLSGAPVELQARTVQFAFMEGKDTDPPLIEIQHISAGENSYAIWKLAWSSMANGLGCFAKGPSVGEPFNGLAIFRR